MTQDRATTAPQANTPAPAPTPTTGRPQPETARWWVPSLAGSLGGLVAAVLSVTPSLLPRPASLQGVLAALAFGVGYLVGVVVWGAVRAALLRRFTLPRPGRNSWIAYALVWLVAVIALPSLALHWQNEIRQLVSMEPLNGLSVGAFLGTFIPLTLLFLLIGKGVRGLYRRFARRLRALLAGLLTAGTVAAGLALVVAGALAGVDRIFYASNHAPEEGVTEPASTYRSAGEGSAIAWDTLGRHGTAFIGGGPNAAKITEITGQPAKEPIRVYAGLESAPTTRARADLVVKELERTGAFQRKVLMVATTTGSGWLEAQTVDSLEYLFGGDTAIASMQYAYTPSWVSFVFDPDAPVDASRALFEAIEARWKQLAVDARPQLLAYGLSLGAHGTQAVFSDVDELRARTDGALLVGSPNGSTMWRTLQSQRDAGTPEWQPVLDGGRQVRWMSRPGDGAAGQGEWERPRVLYLQHATDPITWLSPELFWRRPDWLTPEQRSADLSPSMHWIPVVTGLQVTLDMLVSEAVPASYGHNFGDVVLTGWEQVSTGSTLDAAALERVQAEIATYAQIPLFQE